MNPIFDLWGDFMIDLQLLWLLGLPLVVIAAGIAALVKRTKGK
jgi:hypothetical protein